MRARRREKGREQRGEGRKEGRREGGRCVIKIIGRVIKTKDEPLRGGLLNQTKVKQSINDERSSGKGNMRHCLTSTTPEEKEKDEEARNSPFGRK